jgi:hypothetical protein
MKGRQKPQPLSEQMHDVRCCFRPSSVISKTNDEAIGVLALSQKHAFARLARFKGRNHPKDEGLLLIKLLL